MLALPTIVRSVAFNAVVGCVLVASIASAGVIAHTTGSSSKPIVSGFNSGTGVGVEGSGAQNSGVLGISKGPSTSKTQYAGVAGSDGVPAASAQYDDAVWGNAPGGTGVEGDTAGNHTDFGVAGVYGADTSTYHPNGNVGVWGYSKNGIGVYGQTASADADDPQAAIFGYASSSSTAPGNTAVAGYSNYGLGLSAQSNLSTAAEFFSHSPTSPTMKIFNSGGGPLLLAQAGATHVASLDNGGNLVLAGTLTENGSPAVVVASKGAKHVAYAAAESEPTMEDVGEAQLRFGYSRVTFDPAFASTIDPSRPYLVFVTPAGMTTGTLCVVQRDRNGFTVRENMNGRSSVAFDYRIVARPYASHAERLPLYTRPLGSDVREPRFHVPHGKAPFVP